MLTHLPYRYCDVVDVDYKEYLLRETRPFIWPLSTTAAANSSPLKWLTTPASYSPPRMKNPQPGIFSGPSLPRNEA